MEILVLGSGISVFAQRVGNLTMTAVHPGVHGTMRADEYSPPFSNDEWPISMLNRSAIPLTMHGTKGA
jgi:hypothetical protein